MFLRLFCAFAAGAVFSAAPLFPAPVISEFLASNTRTLADEDGEFSDWIEIHNPDDTAASLAGYTLTDDPATPKKWTFPGVTLPAGETLLVFASGKNRAQAGAQLHTNFSLSKDGEYLALFAPNGTSVCTEFSPGFPGQYDDISYGAANATRRVQLLGRAVNTQMRYHVPTSATSAAFGAGAALADPAWRNKDFAPETNWNSGLFGLGFATGNRASFDDHISTNVQDPMYRTGNHTVYIRAKFSLNHAPSRVAKLELAMRFDDGYAVYLNGTEAAGFNIPATLDYHSLASGTVDQEPITRDHDITGSLQNLVTGENTFALHGLNNTATSSDLLFLPEIWATVPDPGAPGDGATGYFPTPTPGALNGGTGTQTLTEAVAFSEKSGTFTGTKTVALSIAGDNPAGKIIRYTTDNSVPGGASPIYATPLTLSATTNLRARVFDSSTGVSGAVNSGFYLKMDPALAGRVSNLPILVLDSENKGFNSLPDGSSATAAIRQPGRFLMFGKNAASGVASLDDTPETASRMGLRQRGSTAQNLPKRGLSVELWKDDDSNNKVPVLGLAPDCDFVLSPPHQYDTSYFHNAFAYELSRQMGRWAPRTRIVEVFYNASDGSGTLTNNDYVGIYIFTEQVKLTPDRLNYKVVEETDVPPDKNNLDLDDTGAWTGTYLFKIDRWDFDEYRFYSTRWEPSRTEPKASGPNNTSEAGKQAAYVLYRPKLPNLDGGPYTAANGTATSGTAIAAANSGQAKYFQTYWQAFEDALWSDHGNGFTTRNWLNYADRDTFVDLTLLNVFCQNVDFMRLSTFFHKPPNKKIHLGPAWDFDRSMDSKDDRDDPPTAYTWSGTGEASDWLETNLWAKLTKDPDFKQAFADRYAELRKTVFSNENINALIDSWRDEIDSAANGAGSAAARDAAKWPQNTPRGGTYASEVDYMRNYLINRAGWMDNRVFDSTAATLPNPPAIAQNPNGTFTITKNGGGTIYYTRNDTDPRPRNVATIAAPVPAPDASATAYTGAFSASANDTAITARVRTASGWSTPAVFRLRPASEDLVATYIFKDKTGVWNSGANWSTDPAPFPDGAGVTAIIPPLGARPNATADDDSNVDIQDSADRAALVNVTVGHLQFPLGASEKRTRVRVNDSATKGGNPNSTLTLADADGASTITVSGDTSFGNNGAAHAGHVELEVLGGVVLQNEVQLDITNLGGDPEHGALRWREKINGAGGIVKLGHGIASLTGDGKLYSGATRIEQGVLIVTKSSAPPNTSGVSVLDGGQLRLISDGTAEAPAVYQFGGDVALAGPGRAGVIPEGGGHGKLGALRYELGDAAANSHAVLNNAVLLPANADIHVAGATNHLHINGAVVGGGTLRKSGGGVIHLNTESPAHTAPIQVGNGTFVFRGQISSAIQIESGAFLDAAGGTGNLAATAPGAGYGTLVLNGTALQVPASVAPLAHEITFKQNGGPDLTTPANAGNGTLIVASTLATPARISIFLELADGISTGTVVRGAYFLPGGETSDATWNTLLSHQSLRILAPAGNGAVIRESDQTTWKIVTPTRIRAVAATLETDGGVVAGKILEIRFDTPPTNYAAWRAAVFSSGEAANDAIAGPEVSAAGDGISNLMRFALGVGPYESAADRLPRLAVSGNQASFSFPYDPSLQGLRWVVETSPDLVNWNASGVVFDSQLSSDQPDGNGWLHIDDTSTDTRRFYRLRVTQE